MYISIIQETINNIQNLYRLKIKRLITRPHGQFTHTIALNTLSMIGHPCNFSPRSLSRFVTSLGNRVPRQCTGSKGSKRFYYFFLFIEIIGS